MWHRGSYDQAPKTLSRAGVRRMLNEDGQPIKSNLQLGTAFGDRMPATLGEGVSFEYFILRKPSRLKFATVLISRRWPVYCWRMAV